MVFDATAKHKATKASPRSFVRIPTVMSGQEIIDSAFRRASKINVPAKDPFGRMKATELSRVRMVQNSVVSTLGGYIRRFPSFDQLPPFYQELAGVILDMDAVRKSLGTLQWASTRINEIGDEAVPLIKKAPHADVLLQAKQHAYGRFASILKQIDGDLQALDDVRQTLRKLPFIDPDAPTVVVAGYPNVGKSSLVRKVSTGTPEVANYPFTTKGIVVGHFDHARVRHQIVDTPGLLDRPLEDRNAIELQAMQALRHLADVVIFLIDPSEHCGYELKAQLKLLDEVKAAFPDAPLVIAESKSDLKKAGIGETRSRSEGQAVPEHGEIAISTETGEGVDELMKLALGRLRKRAAPTS